MLHKGLIESTLPHDTGGIVDQLPRLLLRLQDVEGQPSNRNVLCAYLLLGLFCSGRLLAG